MHKLARFIAWLVLVLPALAAHATTPTLTSQSQITVSAPGLPQQTFTLSRGNGDWYTMANDAHAFLVLRNVPGPQSAAQQIQLQVEWDGAARLQTINSANNNPTTNKQLFEFWLHVSGPGLPPQDASPKGADAVTITITRMDDTGLEATISGRITGTVPLHISGTIRVQRPAAATAASGTFGNCDPAIHDKLAGAEWRSPSDCEIKFDAHVRQALMKAITPAVSSLTATGWQLTKQPQLDPVNSIARHSEKNPYQLEFTNDRAFVVGLNLNSNSAEAQRYQQAVADIMKKALAQANAGKNPGSLDDLHDAARAASENTQIVISVTINNGSSEIVNFKGGHTVAPLGGGGFTVEVPYNQPSTGGGMDDSIHATYVFLGSYGQPTAKPHSDGSEDILVRGTLNPVHLMAVQSLRIRIEGAPRLTQQVVRQIDWATLRQLMAE